MNLGDLELHLIVAGRWKADGGLMFGVIPKVMWEKQKPADGNNMIDMACVGLIARVNGRVIVCETGIGTKLSEKRAQQVVLREPEGLLQSLKRVGIRPEEVDAVITTHLHWDHAGGLTRRDKQGGLELTFKRARHFIQRTEWDFALHPAVRSQAGYVADDFTPVLSTTRQSATVVRLRDEMRQRGIGAVVDVLSADGVLDVVAVLVDRFSDFLAVIDIGPARFV